MIKNLYKIIFLSFFFFITFNLTEAKAADYPLCDPDYTNERGEINLGAIADPKTIDDNTSGLNLAFNISSALEVHAYSDDDFILFMFGPPVVFIDLRSS